MSIGRLLLAAMISPYIFDQKKVVGGRSVQPCLEPSVLMKISTSRAVRNVYRFSGKRWDMEPWIVIGYTVLWLRLQRMTWVLIWSDLVQWIWEVPSSHCLTEATRDRPVFILLPGWLVILTSRILFYVCTFLIVIPPTGQALQRRLSCKHGRRVRIGGQFLFFVLRSLFSYSIPLSSPFAT